ncbi:MAG: AtzH-like domain-containing protein [Pseudomonadota bacterium]
MADPELTVNEPSVVAELEAEALRYETALVTNDVGTLDECFWQSPQALRFGVAEELYGAEDIASFRRERGAPPRARETLRRSTLTLGQQLGVTTQEFTVLVTGPLGDERRHGRQTQIWARMPDGWRIVSAHVSHRPTAGDAHVLYARAAAALLDLPAAAAHGEAVAANLAVIAGLMAPLMAFDLDDSDEIAGVFRP